MTPTECRNALDRLSLSQRGAARFFGYDERTVRDWVNPKKNGPPPPVALWLEFMLATGITPDQVELTVTA